MSALATPELMISADSHVIEDSELWLKQLPSALRDQAPTYRPEATQQLDSPPRLAHALAPMAEQRAGVLFSTVRRPGFRVLRVRPGPASRSTPPGSWR